MTRKLAWVALFLPIVVGGVMGALVAPRPYEPGFFVWASFVVSAVLLYSDMDQIDGIKEHLGRWRHLMALLTAVLGPFFVLLYLWERRKVLRGNADGGTEDGGAEAPAQHPD